MPKIEKIVVVVNAKGKYFDVIHEANRQVDRSLKAKRCLTRKVSLASAERFGDEIMLTYTATKKPRGTMWT
jgi:hypothetical protein